MEQGIMNCLVESNCNIRVLLICVNYNSYAELYDFLKSVKKSLEKASAFVFIDIFVADNSTEVKDVIIPDSFGLNVSISRHGNLGYLGGAFCVINNLGCVSEYDYVIISNVDLVVDDNFFYELCTFA